MKGGRKFQYDFSIGGEGVAGREDKVGTSHGASN
jgi:hypothetical protein